MDLFAKHNGIETYFSEPCDGTKFCKARLNIHGKYDICPCCEDPLKKGQVILLINNGRLFPNTIVHKVCSEAFETNEQLVQSLYEEYQEALKYKHWFNIG